LSNPQRASHRGPYPSETPEGGDGVLHVVGEEPEEAAGDPAVTDVNVEPTPLIDSIVKPARRLSTTAAYPKSGKLGGVLIGGLAHPSCRRI